MSAKSYLDPLNPVAVTSDSPQHLDDESYAKVVRAVPIPCTDVVFLRRLANGRVQKALWLARRNVYPQKDVWVIGGRIHFNDKTLQDSIARNVLRETGVAIEPSRFKDVSTSYYAWSRTKQHNDGSVGKNIAVTFFCVVSDDELTSISHGLTKDEYEKSYGLQRFSRARIVAGNVHPALLDLYDALFPSFANRLRNAFRALFPKL